MPLKIVTPDELRAVSKANEDLIDETINAINIKLQARCVHAQKAIIGICEVTTCYNRLSPEQKASVIICLRSAGYTVTEHPAHPDWIIVSWEHERED